MSCGAHLTRQATARGWALGVARWKADLEGAGGQGRRGKTAARDAGSARQRRRRQGDQEERFGPHLPSLPRSDSQLRAKSNFRRQNRWCANRVRKRMAADPTKDPRFQGGVRLRKGGRFEAAAKLL